MTLALLTSASLASPIWFGFATAEMTPPEPLPLGGYTARQDRLLDPGGQPLTARVLRLRQGAKAVAIVSVEMLTVPGSLTREVEQRVRAGGFTGLLLLCATHTHCAPDSQLLNDRMRVKVPGIAQFQSKWLEWYADRIAKAILRAAPAHRLSKLRLLEGTAPISTFRRERITGAPMVPPQTVSVVRFESDRAAYEIRHFAAHPTVRSERWNHTSGDWPAAWNGLDPDSGLFLNGMIGDVAPAPRTGDTEAARIRSMGSDLAGARLSETWSTPSALIQTASVAAVLPRATPHPEFAAANRIPEPLAATLVRSFAPESATVTVVALGEVALVGVPGEPTAMAGQKLAAAASSRRTILVSFAREWIGYVLDPKEYARGGYESRLAFHGPDVVVCLADAIRSAFRSFGASERAGRAR